MGSGTSGKPDYHKKGTVMGRGSSGAEGETSTRQQIVRLMQISNNTVQNYFDTIDNAQSAEQFAMNPPESITINGEKFVKIFPGQKPIERFVRTDGAVLREYTTAYYSEYQDKNDQEDVDRRWPKIQIVVTEQGSRIGRLGYRINGYKLNRGWGKSYLYH